MPLWILRGPHDHCRRITYLAYVAAFYAGNIPGSNVYSIVYDFVLYSKFLFKYPFCIIGLLGGNMSVVLGVVASYFILYSIPIIDMQKQ